MWPFFLPILQREDWRKRPCSPGEPTEREGGKLELELSWLPKCTHHATPFQYLKTIWKFLLMFTYLANSMYTSHGLLLSNKHIYKIFQKQSFLSKIKYTYYDQCDQKRTLEGKSGLSESESASVQIQYRQTQWSPQVPNLLLTNSIKQLPGAFFVYQRPLAGTLFADCKL